MAPIMNWRHELKEPVKGTTKRITSGVHAPPFPAKSTRQQPGLWCLRIHGHAPEGFCHFASAMAQSSLEGYCRGISRVASMMMVLRLSLRSFDHVQKSTFAQPQSLSLMPLHGRANGALCSELLAASPKAKL